MATHNQGHRGDTTPQLCSKSISISRFYSELSGLPSTADLLFSLHLKIKPRASALALNAAHTLTRVYMVRSMIKLSRHFKSPPSIRGSGGILGCLLPPFESISGSVPKGICHMHSVEPN